MVHIFTVTNFNYLMQMGDNGRFVCERVSVCMFVFSFCTRIVLPHFGRFQNQIQTQFRMASALEMVMLCEMDLDCDSDTSKWIHFIRENVIGTG